MEDIISKFNLPSYIKGKSFAEASKIINKRSGDRTDVESVETKRELLDRLKQAQEFVKSQEQEQEQGPMHQMPDGSMMPGESHGEEAQQSTYAYGGGVDQLKLNQMFGGGAVPPVDPAAAGMSDGMAGGIAAGAGLASSLLGGPKEGEESIIAGDAEQNAKIDQAKAAVASAFGPIGSAVAGVSKLGESVGEKIGGDAGAAVASVFAPEKAMIATMQNKDANTMQKIGSTIPGVGGVIAKGPSEFVAGIIAASERCYLSLCAM